MTVGWTCAILFLTLTPDVGGEKFWLFQIPHMDKVAHFGLFFILAQISLPAFRLEYFKESKSILISIIYGLAFSILTEFGQMFVVGRTGSFFDFIADMFGVFVGVIVATRLYRRNE